MFPILIDLGRVSLPIVGEVPLQLPTYGLLFAVGAVIAWVWFMRRARALGTDPELAFNLSFYSLLAGLLGAKLTLVIVDWDYYSRDGWRILGTIRSAGVLMGGVLVASLVFYAYSTRRNLPTFRLADAIAAPLALAQAIGRLGCFAAGCCYGVRSESGFCAITFVDPVAREQTGVPLFEPLVATQLIQMGSDLVLALLLTWLWRKRPSPEGTVFWTYVLLYSATRGVIEFWRGDAQRGMFFHEHVSTSQVFAVAGILLATVMLLRGRFGSREAGP